MVNVKSNVKFELSCPYCKNDLTYDARDISTEWITKEPYIVCPVCNHKLYISKNKTLQIEDKKSLKDEFIDAKHTHDIITKYINEFVKKHICSKNQLAGLEKWEYSDYSNDRITISIRFDNIVTSYNYTFDEIINVLKN